MFSTPFGFDLSPDEVVREDAWEEYQQHLRFLFSEVTELNVNLYIGERILAFPFETLFGEGPDYSIFFSQVLDNTFNMSIVQITRLAGDRGPDDQTLMRFRDRLPALLKPEFQQAFQEYLHEAGFDQGVFEQRTEQLVRRAREVRNSRIAHLSGRFFRAIFDSALPQVRLLFSDMQQLAEEFTAFFQVLTLNSDLQVLPDSYQRQTSDIAEILDHLARTSHLLQMPEKDRERWMVRRPHLMADQIDRLNVYRRRFGLAEI